jgi:hypothetical protein
VTLDWQTLSARDCWENLYEIGGALRRMGKPNAAQHVERVADELYPGRIKPAPIVPRTTT